MTHHNHTYRVTLTPRVFQMTAPDWHICIEDPDGNEYWDMSPWKWSAKLKARWMIRGIKRGRYQDKRKPDFFEV